MAAKSIQVEESNERQQVAEVELTLGACDGDAKTIHQKRPVPKTKFFANGTTDIPTSASATGCHEYTTKAFSTRAFYEAAIGSARLSTISTLSMILQDESISPQDKSKKPQTAERRTSNGAGHGTHHKQGENVD